MSSVPWKLRSQPGADRSVAPAANDLVAERYRLGVRLGSGGDAEVWRAADELAGDEVAVKLVPAGGAGPSRLLREAALLRVVGGPGVVRVRDAGSDERHQFLVMDLVSGAAFPGPVASAGWAALSETVRALLESLAQVHACGVVHGDLGPSNVLVDAAGVPTLLDFGIAHGPDAASEREAAAGTVAYLAPERLRGEPPSVSADVYAAAVMIYEALAGERPMEGRTASETVALRGAGKVRPLREVAPMVPDVVSDTVASMLRPAVAGRPASAAAVLAALAPAFAHGALPAAVGDALWAGTVDEIVAALRSGVSVDLVGPMASGRSECVRRVVAALGEAGATVVRAEGCRGAALTALARGVAAGAVGVVDSAPGSAAPSVRERVAAMRNAGGVVLRACSPGTRSAGPARSVMLAAHDEHALRTLFHGPERVLHLPSDAAKLLWLETLGHPGRVWNVLQRWLRAGHVGVDGDRLRVSRAQLDQLEVVQTLAAASVRRGPAPPVPARGLAAEVMAAASVADRHATAALVAEVLERPIGDVTRALATLVRCGALERWSDGTWRPPGGPGSVAGAEGEARAGLHRRIAAALRPGRPGRLQHLARSGGRGADHVLALAAEVRAAAAAHEGRAQLGVAVALLEDGLLLLRLVEGAPAEARVEAHLDLLAHWIELAVTDRSPVQLGRARYALGRTGPVNATQSRLVAAMQLLVDAARDFEVDLQRAVLSAHAVPAFILPSLERLRFAVRARVSQALGPGEGQRMHARVEAEALEIGDAETILEVAAAGAWLLYRDGRFADAACQHAGIARQTQSPMLAITSMLASASAWMEDFAFERARAIASEGMAMAARARQPYLEARAAWIVRTCGYRLDEMVDIEPELLEAVTLLRTPLIGSLVKLTEAAIAWRVGDHAAARGLATELQAESDAVGRSARSLIARCIAIAAGADATAEERAGLALRAKECSVPGLGVQALGLLRAPVEADEMLALAKQVPENRWDRRMDVVSVAEALTACGVRFRTSSRGTG